MKAVFLAALPKEEGVITGNKFLSQVGKKEEDTTKIAYVVDFVNYNFI